MSALTESEGNEASGAIFSPCRLYRYELWRRWSADLRAPLMVFVGLNPSTADAAKDDATIRRCIGFAKREGCGGMFMLNLFAYRSRWPSELRRDDPVGPHNDQTLKWWLASSTKTTRIVACWGAEPMAQARALTVLSWAVAKKPMVLARDRCLCLGWTQEGAPRHPLFLAKNTPIVPLMRPAALSS